MSPKTEISRHPLFSPENLYQAYRKCRRHKRNTQNTQNAMIFEQNLDEYLQWQKGKVVYRCPIPSRSMRFVNQKSWFKRHLPGHVLLIQQGGFWEFDMESAALVEVTNNEALAAAKSWPRRFPDRRLRHLKPLLWDSGLLVGWVGETGRRLSNIAERALICRWSSTN